MRSAQVRRVGLGLAMMAACGLAGAQAPASQSPLPGSSLRQQIEAMVKEPGVVRAHWGVIVTAMDGTVLYSLNEGQLFQPASNAKLFTTAAALALLGEEQSRLGPDSRYQTEIIGDGVFSESKLLKGNLVIMGDGDAGLSDREFPYVAPVLKAAQTSPAAIALLPLQQMADAVVKTGLKVVTGDVIGDDTLFPFEPYATDWAIDDALWGYGAPVSALSINDNQIKVKIKTGPSAGLPGVVAVDPDVPYYAFDLSGLKTGAAKSASNVEIYRAIGSRTVRLYGTIAADAQPDVEEIAIEDPAEYAAVALKEMLIRAGVVVKGEARAKHRLPAQTSGFLAATKEPIADLANAVQTWRLHGALRENLMPKCSGCEVSIPPRTTDPIQKVLAAHVSPPLAEDVVVTNKTSQNLHAELLLHQLAAAFGKDGSTAQGARVVRQFLLNAGVDKDDFVFYDGSGLSGHDLVTPRATARLLEFAALQPWFAEFKASLPVGGLDGSLTHRFTAAPLKGHVFAKTGTLGEARALSGYIECASGRTVIFSVMVGDHDPGTSADRDVIDRIVGAIAAAE